MRAVIARAEILEEAFGYLQSPPESFEEQVEALALVLELERQGHIMARLLRDALAEEYNPFSLDGMEPEDVEHVQGTACTLARTRGGTGIGLALHHLAFLELVA